MLHSNFILQRNFDWINERLISNNKEDYSLRGHRMNLQIERDFLSEAKRNGKAFPRVCRFTVTRGRNSRGFVGVVRVEECIRATRLHTS